MKVWSDLIKANVRQKLDQRNLDLDVEEFKELNPTAENIVIVIYNILREKIDNKIDLSVKLYETERNFVEYPAGWFGKLKKASNKWIIIK